MRVSEYQEEYSESAIEICPQRCSFIDMSGIDDLPTEDNVSDELPTDEERAALMTELGMSEDEMRALELQANAQKRAFAAVQKRSERWVSVVMCSGELGLGNDDYQTLVSELIKDHGTDYWHIFSIIGPKE